MNHVVKNQPNTKVDTQNNARLFKQKEKIEYPDPIAKLLKAKYFYARDSFCRFLLVYEQTPLILSDINSCA